MSVTNDILDADEHEYGIFRQHYIFLVGQVVTEFVLLGLVFVALALSQQITAAASANAQTWVSTIINGLLIGTAVVLVGSAGLDFARWYYHAVVVTNRRVIRREGLIQRSIADMSLERISEIRMNQSVWGRIFGYADFVVMSESETGQEIRGIGNPIEFRTTLDDARVGEYRPHIHGARESEPVAQPQVRHEPVRSASAMSAPSTTQIMVASADDAHRLNMWNMLESLYEQGILTADELEAKRQLLFEPKRPVTPAPAPAYAAELDDDDDTAYDDDADADHDDEDLRATPPPPPYQPPYPSSPYQSRDPSQQREE